jgi:cytochrome c oxidase subunit 1
LFVYIVWKTVRGGEKADDRVWEGAEGLEWTLPSPPPYHSFETAPEVK